jgi:thiol-disulfide isomerase/thioredoxin
VTGALFAIGVAFAEPEMIPMSALDVVGQPAPPIELTLDDGTKWNLAKQKGKLVVVSFWASWCGPCQRELPALTEWAKTRPDVEFIAVNVDRKKSDALPFLKKVKVGLPIGYDNDAQAVGQYSVMSMPTTFVIDKKGRVHAKKVGYSEERGFTELGKYLDEAKAAR